MPSSSELALVVSRILMEEVEKEPQDFVGHKDSSYLSDFVDSYLDFQIGLFLAHTEGFGGTNGTMTQENGMETISGNEQQPNNMQQGTGLFAGTHADLNNDSVQIPIAKQPFLLSNGFGRTNGTMTQENGMETVTGYKEQPNNMQQGTGLFAGTHADLNNDSVQIPIAVQPFLLSNGMQGTSGATTQEDGMETDTVQEQTESLRFVAADVDFDIGCVQIPIAVQPFLPSNGLRVRQSSNKEQHTSSRRTSEIMKSHKPSSSNTGNGQTPDLRQLTSGCSPIVAGDLNRFYMQDSTVSGSQAIGGNNILDFMAPKNIDVTQTATTTLPIPTEKRPRGRPKKETQNPKAKAESKRRNPDDGVKKKEKNNAACQRSRDKRKLQKEEKKKECEELEKREKYLLETLAMLETEVNKYKVFTELGIRVWLNKKKGLIT